MLLHDEVDDVSARFGFNIKAFRRAVIPKMIALWLAISGTLSLLSCLNGTRDLLWYTLVCAFTGFPFFGFYFNRRHHWKLAYLIVGDTELRFFRLEKDGFMSDTSPYEYEARETIVITPFKYTVSGTKIRLSGNIYERIYKDKNHRKVETIKRKDIKIPMYFGERKELLAALSRYN